MKKHLKVLIEGKSVRTKKPQKEYPPVPILDNPPEPLSYAKFRMKHGDKDVNEILESAKIEAATGLYYYSTHIVNAETQLELDKHKFRAKNQARILDKFIGDKLSLTGVLGNIDLTALSPEEFITRFNEIARNKWKSGGEST